MTHREAEIFFSYFGVPIKQFLCPITNTLDVIKFDEFLKVPKGISTRQFIEQRYGLAAVNFVITLF